MSPDSVLVVGGPNLGRTELLNLTNFKWDFTVPYPKDNQANSAKTLFHKDAFYVFGAVISSSISDEIFKYDFIVWSMVGKLQTKRLNYSVQKIKSPHLLEMVYIFGGSGNNTNEKCEFGSTITCNQVGPTEVENLENPTLFGFQQKNCRIMASNVEEAERLFILFANSTDKTQNSTELGNFTMQASSNSTKIGTTLSSSPISNNTNANSTTNLSISNTSTISSTTDLPTVSSAIKPKVQKNSNTTTEMQQNSTTQATSKTTVKSTVKGTQIMTTSTTTYLSKNSTFFGKNTLVTNSTTQLTTNLTVMSTTQNLTSNGSTSSNLTEITRENSYTHHLISETFAKFGDDSLVGSPYTIQLSRTSSELLSENRCSVVHYGKLFLYGGKATPRSIYSFNCLTQEFEVEESLSFDFVDGACASNNRLIFLCFSNQDTKQCYKSFSATSGKWWQKFISTEKSIFTHKSVAISMSSGNLVMFYKL